MDAPPMLSFLDGSDDEADGLSNLPASAQGSDRSLQESFMLSQSGTFKTEDFKLNKTGLVMQDISAEGGSPDRGAGSGTSPGSMHGLDVKDLAELETLGELGRGASGVVYKARHTPSGTIVAVKQVPILEKPKRDQIVSELRIMRQHLACPWLVPLYNAFYDDAKVYTVLELMDGGSVEDLVAKHAPEGGLKDERELGKVALQMLNGLNYLHRQCHQIHRDLKPANVMLNSKGAVKITDFGITSQLLNTAGYASTFVGTTIYMAPERLQGDRYSYSSDIWSFGLIILELASGKYPYPNAASYFELLQCIMEGASPSLPEGDCSNELGEFIGICLDKEAGHRPAAKDLLKHPWVRMFPLKDDLMLSMAFDNMKISGS